MALCVIKHNLKFLNSRKNKRKTLKTSIFEKSVIKCTNQRFTKKLSGFFCERFFFSSIYAIWS